MKTNLYYFKFVVCSHYAREFNSFAPAKRFADKTGEKVYLQIFNRRNTAQECYDERIIMDASEIESKKLELIESFNKLVK